VAQTTVGVVPAPASSIARRSRRRRETIEGWAFVAPGTVLILGLSIFPAVWAFILSLQQWNGFSDAKPVGGANYTEMLSDSQLWGAVGHTLLYVILFVPASVLVGLFLAIALNRKIRLMSFYRTAIFVPFVVSAATTGVLTNYLFDPQFGIVNNVLRSLGLPAQGWLADPNQAMVVIAIMSLWGSAAFTTVIYLAALQDISPELLEAARIDGANTLQSFWHVVWPELAPVTLFISIWQIIEATQLFDLVYTTTKGGPLGSTKTVVYYLWDAAFQQFQFGYGSAVAYGLFGVTLVITIGIVLYSRRTKIEAF
jgi:multiple sugar transport system permease protein